MDQFKVGVAVKEQAMLVLARIFDLSGSPNKEVTDELLIYWKMMPPGTVTFSKTGAINRYFKFYKFADDVEFEAFLTSFNRRILQDRLLSPREGYREQALQIIEEIKPLGILYDDASKTLRLANALENQLTEQFTASFLDSRYKEILSTVYNNPQRAMSLLGSFLDSIVKVYHGKQKLLHTKEDGKEIFSQPQSLIPQIIRDELQYFKDDAGIDQTTFEFKMVASLETQMKGFLTLLEGLKMVRNDKSESHGGLDTYSKDIPENVLRTFCFYGLGFYEFLRPSLEKKIKEREGES